MNLNWYHGNVTVWRGNVTISHQIRKCSPSERVQKSGFGKPMPSRLPFLDKHVDGRPKYISCWVEFLKFIKRELISRLQMHTSYIQERHTYNWHFIKSGDPQSGSSASPAYLTSVQKYAHSVLKHSGVVEIDDVVHSFLEKPIRYLTNGIGDVRVLWNKQIQTGSCKE